MLAFCARRLISTARGSARGVATRTGSNGPSLLRQHAKPVAFAGLACAASFAAADTCIRYRRGNEAAFGKWNRILDPPEQMRQMAAEGAKMTGRWISEHIDALSAHREGQEQRGEPLTDYWEASDMWKRNPQTQRQLAFGAPFVIVNAGMILLGLCSRRPHLMVGRNVQPLLRGSFFATATFTLDMSYVFMYSGIGTVLSFLPGEHRGFHTGGGVLAWMPVEQLAACYGSAAAVVTLALTASKVRPLPVLGCALGACAITAAMFGWAVAGASFASSIGSSDMVLADVLEVLGHGEGHSAIAEREAAAGRAARAQLAGPGGPYTVNRKLDMQQRQDLQMQVCEHAKNEFVAKQAHAKSCSSVTSIAVKLFWSLSLRAAVSRQQRLPRTQRVCAVQRMSLVAAVSLRATVSTSSDSSQDRTWRRRHLQARAHGADGEEEQ